MSRRADFPAYDALRAAVQRWLTARTPAEHAEAWAEAQRLKDAGLEDERRMRAYLAGRGTPRDSGAAA
jgi:hypothetical protein